MSELIPVEIEPRGEPPVHLGLYHYVPENTEEIGGTRKPVLLLHGASASHQTFITPDGGLAKWLAQRHFDPWMLDWRGSGCVVDDQRNERSLLDNGTVYNFNLAAQHDIRDAISVMRDQHVKGKIAVLGFCMGGAILAESVALGYITEKDVDCIVLMTLGLFYEATIDGRVKCEDRILEQLEQRIRAGEDVAPWIDPRVAATTPKLLLKSPWHSDLENLYKSWPGALKSHAEELDRTTLPPHEAVNCMCNRLSFMYGMPYHHHNLDGSIHGSDSTAGLLPKLFGAIPLHMFIHGARNIRKGHATFYDRRAGTDPFLSPVAHANFRSLSKVTLITGALDRLWHRNSIDLMHEWLCRGTPEHRRKFKKRVFPNYAHQDLLWGEDSKERIFPTIKAGLEADS
ncbi:MAG: alpha/beta fold hydrolase [Vicinamibacterales bacterium]